MTFAWVAGIAGCSGALTANPVEEPDAADDAADDVVIPPMCPAPADVHEGEFCERAGESCLSNESPWPPECGDRGGPRATCFCRNARWTCARLEIACVDAGPPIVDAGTDVLPPPDDAPNGCPPPDAVRKDGTCSPSFLSCPSVENKIPACVGGYEPTTCHCLSGQWSCEFYGIACPDAGTDAGPDALEAAVDSPGDSLIEAGDEL